MENKLFVSGSISGNFNKSKLQIFNSIDRAILKEIDFLIGDAPGADKTIQEYLFSKNYPNVTVCHVGSNPRHFLDKRNWDLKEIYIDTENPKLYKNGKFTRLAQMQKDAEMCKFATYGLAIWQDTRTNRFNKIEVSKGTLNNMIRLLSDNKPVRLFYLPDPALTNIWLRSEDHLSKFIYQHCKSETIKYYNSLLKEKEGYVQDQLDIL